MKLRLGLLAWAGALDPAWNPDRPLRNLKPSGAFSEMSDILDRRRYDKDLYNRLDRMFFRNGNATGFAWPGQVDVAGELAAQDYVIECGQSEMFFAARTDSYDAFNVVNADDFTLNDVRCNGNSTNLEWIGIDDGAGGQIEVIFASIPLDTCNTTVSFDSDSNELVFTNTIMNGAFAVHQDDNDAANGVHSGITTTSVIDFGVSCRYTAEYKDVGLEMETEHADINQVINVFESNQFEFGINFVVPDANARSASNVTFVDVQVAEYNVGEAAYFFVEMEHPNDKLYLEVISCTMISGHTPGMNYTIIDNQCEDPFTNTNLIDQYTPEKSLISFTMFEFVSDIPDLTQQTNDLHCSIRLCLKDPATAEEMCPSNKDNCL